MSHTDIQVIFIDERTDEAFAQTHMPLENLPVSFATNMVLDMGAEEWQVVAAEPPDSVAFAITGRVTLLVRKVQAKDPTQILFSLPTINDTIPNSSETIAAEPVFALHHDVWRQVEWISNSHLPQIDAEFEDILTVYQHHRESHSGGLGFREVHQRKRIAQPFVAPFSLSELQHVVLDDAAVPLAMAFDGTPGCIVDGFAFQVESMTVYGDATAGQVKTLGLHMGQGIGLSTHTVSALSSMMQEHDLCLVDWCSMTRVTGDFENLSNYLGGR